MVMQSLIERAGHVGVYELDRFYQWGTPEDLRDYEAWAHNLRALDDFMPRVRDAKMHASLVVPMAGRGQRFVDQGYSDPKPLIDVAGRPMIQQAIACLPEPFARVLVAQREHVADPRFRATVANLPGNTQTVALDRVTEGQAITARLGVAGLGARVAHDRPLLFAPCDTGYLYDLETWLALERSADVELIVWTARDHLPAIWRPHMYGWVQVSPDGSIERVAVKQPVAGVPVADQQVITGTFWFRDAHTFLREVEMLVAANDRVRGEFYLDTIARRMVERGARVRAFKVDKYIPWGTPEELKTFDYWNAVHRGGRVVQ
jgi:bifunctional N-acetylglucosamine-1-phosphate-uridyltransferase/glucosamine-1-phosphate-acetyltransferase GlmU-like protein